ncbi:MAG TPA: hypothetical protein VID94_01520 [Acidimicrobiales bacterium]
MTFSRTGRLSIVVGLTVLLVGCGGDDGAEEAATTTTTTPATTTVGVDCPNPEGGSINTCLGDLDAGAHETTTLAPTLAYLVPDGWSNQEDLPGNFLLLPPGSTLEGVNPETSDFLGVYSSVGAPLGCAEQADPAVASTPQAMVDWLGTQAAIEVSAPTPVTIGGLSGLQVDLAFDDARAEAGCTDDLGSYALAIVGTGRSSLAHGVSPGYALRLAFLTNGDAVMAVELADAPDGGSDYEDFWGTAADVVDSFRFA